tara:strand:- start:132 stop:371 length:240 start_codon:yes stop_codon:yes gene_type:complete
MKINFTFDNITQLEELYYAVENIPSEILEDSKEYGVPVKEEQSLYEVILKLKSKLEEVKTTMEEEEDGYNSELDAASYT